MADISRSLRNVTLRQLRTFRIVAHLGSLSAAARELHLTQPAVTLQLKELEASCGLSLYERVGRGIRLTEAGEELAAAAASVLDTLRATQERLDALRGLRTGLLRIAAVSTAKYFAPGILAAFDRAHPGIAVRLAVGNRATVVRRLADRECDVAIMGRPPAEPPTDGAVFADHPLVVIAPPDHHLVGRHAVPLQDLAPEAFVMRERGSGTRASMEELFTAQDLDVRTAMEADSNETIKQAVIAGMGISFISAHTIALEVATGKLAILDVQGLPLMRQWYVLYLRGRRLSPAASAFRDYVIRYGGERIHATLGIPRGATVPC